MDGENAIGKGLEMKGTRGGLIGATPADIGMSGDDSAGRRGRRPSRRGVAGGKVGEGGGEDGEGTGGDSCFARPNKGVKCSATAPAMLDV